MNVHRQQKTREQSNYFKEWHVDTDARKILCNKKLIK